jgi:hypothetical protein
VIFAIRLLGNDSHRRGRVKYTRFTKRTKVDGTGLSMNRAVGGLSLYVDYTERHLGAIRESGARPNYGRGTKETETIGSTET